MRGIFFSLALAAVSTSLAAAPSQRRSEYEEGRSILSNLQHEVGNHQVEMAVFEERLITLDVTLDTIRQEVSSLKQQQKDKHTAAAQEIEVKIGNLDLSSKSVVSDLKSLKNQLNETTQVLGQFKGRLGALEKIIDAQNQNIDALQAAMRSLAEALQIKEGIKATKIYVVKSGDALEKIARTNHMTVDEVKELNGLTTPKIIIGQKLLVFDR